MARKRLPAGEKKIPLTGVWITRNYVTEHGGMVKLANEVMNFLTKLKPTK